MKLRERIRTYYLPYIQAIPQIVRFQIFSNIALALILQLLKWVSMQLIYSTGRIAVSSGDFAFLFRTWQGPLIIIIALAVLFFYVAFDLNTQIIYASRLLEDKPVKMIDVIREGLLSIREFLTPDGVGIVLYISLIAPLIGFGLTISLTSDLYVPTFISSVITENPLYRIAYYTALLIFLIIGFLNFFTLHGILISNLRSSVADDNSRYIMKNHWKDYLKSSFLFALNTFLVNVLAFLLIVIPAGFAVYFFGDDPYIHRFITIFTVLLLITVFSISNTLLETFYIIRITELYYRYMGLEERLVPDEKRKVRYYLAFRLSLLLLLIVPLSMLINYIFDDFFKDQTETYIIAHRAGGNEAPENTVKGIEQAAELGAYGSEIDIQRTIDGYYIVNHDGNFARLCADERKPEEMTLAEIRQLVINDPRYPDDPQQVATFEEMLDACKGKLVLFVELKGNTADEQMVDDAVRIIREHDMAKECVLISLKYDLINYAKTAYPDIETAYLTFISFGDTANLNCDYLGLEDESAASSTVDAIHNKNKKVMVWTPNENRRQEYFLKSDVDFIITDNVSQAIEIREDIANRTDTEIIIDWLFDAFAN